MLSGCRVEKITATTDYLFCAFDKNKKHIKDLKLENDKFDPIDLATLLEKEEGFSAFGATATQTEHGGLFVSYRSEDNLKVECNGTRETQTTKP